MPRAVGYLVDIIMLPLTLTYMIQDMITQKFDTGQFFREALLSSMIQDITTHYLNISHSLREDLQLMFRLL